MMMPASTDRLWIVTDLDGTLLDEASYAYDAAREALDVLANGGIPLIIATGKTRAEVEHVAAGIVGHAVYIVENGGEIVVPAGGWSGPPDLELLDGPLVIRLGVSRDMLVRHLADIAAETGASVRGFAQLSLAETASLTGLPWPLAVLARDRHYDEPFLVRESEKIPAIVEAANRRGLRVTHGGRWHHLTGDTDKGTALTVLYRHLAPEGRASFTIGLGDAANDLSFLRIVDRPIVIPRPHGLDVALASALPGAECAPQAGPAGWNAAVLAVLSGRELPAVKDWEKTRHGERGSVRGVSLE